MMTMRTTTLTTLTTTAIPCSTTTTSFRSSSSFSRKGMMGARRSFVVGIDFCACGVTSGKKGRRRRRKKNDVRTNAMTADNTNTGAVPLGPNDGNALERVQMQRDNRNAKVNRALVVFDIADVAAAPEIEIIAPSSRSDEESMIGESEEFPTASLFDEIKDAMGDDVVSPDAEETTTAPDVVVQSSMEDATLENEFASSDAEETITAPDVVVQSSMEDATLENEFPSPDAEETTTAPDVVVQSSIKDAVALFQAEEREAKIASGEIVEPQRTEGGFFGLLADSFETVLLKIQDVERALGIPYPVGNSIIILTALVKLITFPLTKSQVVSSLNMKNLQPQVAAIKEKYEDDSERMNAEINRIYEDNEVNPLAGCGPLILTLPVFIGLYRAFKNAGIDGVFDEPWLFIPNLSGPSDTQDISWLWPLDDDFAPPLEGGWEAAWPYLVMPILTTATQFYSMNAMQPKEEEQTEEMKNQSQLVKFLPLMIGYISLTVPAGLAMYWLFNNVFTTLTQVYLRNFGGAEATVEASDDILIKIPLGCAVIDDSFERVPNDEVETYLETNPSVIWNEEWLEEWRQQQAQEISESLENAENEMVDLGASEEVAALYAEKLKNRAKRYREVEKRKNATSKELEDLIAEYTKNGKSQEEIANLQKLLEATITFEAEMKEKKMKNDASKELKEYKGLNLTGEEAGSSSSSSSSSEEEKAQTTR